MLGLSQLCLEMVSRCPACNASTRRVVSTALAAPEKDRYAYNYIHMCIYIYLFQLNEIFLQKLKIKKTRIFYAFDITREKYISLCNLPLEFSATAGIIIIASMKTCRCSNIS